jgi:CTP:molybdopterin cytidylyltransferase MocA
MIYAVVLAAGASTRMQGKPKALLQDAEGRTFVQRIAVAARDGGAGGVIVVVGPPHGDAIRRALPTGVGNAINPRPDRGMMSSVQTGVGALPRGSTGALIWPVDIPYVKSTTVRQLLDVAPGKIVIPRHGGKNGHPLRVPRARFGDLMALDAEGGLKAFLEANQTLVEYLDVDDPGVLIDVDTPADHARGAAPPVEEKPKKSPGKA